MYLNTVNKSTEEMINLEIEATRKFPSQSTVIVNYRLLFRL